MRLFETKKFESCYKFPSHFSLMCVGSSGVGKTTFVFNLIKYGIIERPKMIKYYHPNIAGNSV